MLKIQPCTIYFRVKTSMDHTNKYVVFHGNPNECRAILVHRSLHLQLHGGVSISVTGIPALESNRPCPESIDESLPISVVNQTQVCNKVKGYNDHITCDLNEGYEWCTFSFPYKHCNATLGHREVAFQCNGHELHLSTSLLTLYQWYIFWYLPK